MDEVLVALYTLIMVRTPPTIINQEIYLHDLDEQQQQQQQQQLLPKQNYNTYNVFKLHFSF